MKKLTLLLALSLSCTTTLADTIGFEVGATAWRTEIDGRLVFPNLTTNGFTSDLDDFDVSAENSTGFYALLEHPIPVLPNIKISHVEIEHGGTGTFTFGSTSYSSYGEASLTNTDYTLYYEVLDNWINLDLGVTARQYDGYLYLEAIDYKPAIDSMLGLLYAKAQLDLPLTGLSLGASINVGKNNGWYGDNEESALDADAYLRYESVIGLGLTLGYRHFESDTELREGEITDFILESEVNGPYLSAFFHF